MNYLKVASTLKAPLAFFAMTALVGCGRGVYEEQFDKTLKIQKRAQAFVVLEGETRPIPGSSATIRLPKPPVGKSWTLLAGDEEKKAKIGFLSDVPELAVYETWGLYDYSSGRGDINMFCYLGSVPLSGAEAKFKSLAELEDAILEKATRGSGSQQALEVGTKAMDEVVCPPKLDGTQGSLQWRRIQLKGKSIFERKPEGQTTINPEAETAVIELWLHESAGDPKQAYVVLWRAPFDLAAKTRRSKDEPEREPVIDLVGSLSALSAGTVKSEPGL